MTSTSDSDSSATVPAAPVPKVPVTMDSRGRVRVPKEQRQLILAEFERSGVSAVEFARQTGLKYSTLAGWLQRHRRTKPPSCAPAMRLLEAVVEPNAGDKLPLVLELPGGARMEIKDAGQAMLAGAFLRTLAKSC